MQNQLNQTQLEILKLFRHELPQEQWIELKGMIAEYFAQHATAEMDKLWEENAWTEKTMQKWSEEHMRRKA